MWLKIYGLDTFKHHIPLKEDIRSYRIKQRQANHVLCPLIEKEVRKVCNTQIIILVRYLKWVAKHVPIIMKNGEISLCVDFRNLNKGPLKDNYPLEKMDQMLQKLLGSQRMFMLNGFSSYNQVRMHPKDVMESKFTTIWGNFSYKRIPFGMINIGITF